MRRSVLRGGQSIDHSVLFAPAGKRLFHCSIAGCFHLKWRSSWSVFLFLPSPRQGSPARQSFFRAGRSTGCLVLPFLAGKRLFHRSIARRLHPWRRFARPRFPFRPLPRQGRPGRRSILPARRQADRSNRPVPVGSCPALPDPRGCRFGPGQRSAVPLRRGSPPGRRPVPRTGAGPPLSRRFFPRRTASGLLSCPAAGWSGFPAPDPSAAWPIPSPAFLPAALHPWGPEWAYRGEREKALWQEKNPPNPPTLPCEDRSAVCLIPGSFPR